LRQRLENYIVNSARLHEFKACRKVTTTRGGRRFFARPIVPRDRDCRPEGGYRLRLGAKGDPLKKTEAGRKAINAGIGIVVPIEDTADLMP
jgi:hypothetical protein